MRPSVGEIVKMILELLQHSSEIFPLDRALDDVISDRVSHIVSIRTFTTRDLCTAVSIIFIANVIKMCGRYALGIVSDLVPAPSSRISY